MKKMFLLVLSLLVVAAVCVGGAFCVVADEVSDIYGTFENGIVAKGQFADGKITPTDTYMNGDFQLGFQYWTCRTKNAPSEVAKLITEGDNTYIQFTPMKEWDGIITPPFACDTAKVGMKFGVLYKWRGEGGMQIFVEYKGGTGRVVGGAGKLLKEAVDENDWNLSLVVGSKGLPEPNPDIVDQTVRFQLGVQITNDLETNIQVDDVMFGIFRDNENKLYALDGKTVICDVDALEKEMQESQDEINKDVDDSDFEFDIADPEPIVDEDTDNDTNTEINNDTDVSKDNETSKGLGAWLWVIIGVSVAIVAAGTVFLIFKIKKH